MPTTTNRYWFGAFSQYPMLIWAGSLAKIASKPHLALRQMGWEARSRLVLAVVGGRSAARSLLMKKVLPTMWILEIRWWRKWFDLKLEGRLKSMRNTTRLNCLWCGTLRNVHSDVGCASMYQCTSACLKDVCAAGTNIGLINGYLWSNRLHPVVDHCLLINLMCRWWCCKFVYVDLPLCVFSAL